MTYRQKKDWFKEQYTVVDSLHRTQPDEMGKADKKKWKRWWKGPARDAINNTSRNIDLSKPAGEVKAVEGPVSTASPISNSPDGGGQAGAVSGSQSPAPIPAAPPSVAHSSSAGATKQSPKGKVQFDRKAHSTQTDSANHGYLAPSSDKFPSQNGQGNHPNLGKKDKDLNELMKRIEQEITDTEFTDQEEYWKWRTAVCEEIDKHRVDGIVDGEPMEGLLEMGNVKQMVKASKLLDKLDPKFKKARDPGSKHDDHELEEPITHRVPPPRVEPPSMYTDTTGGGDRAPKSWKPPEQASSSRSKEGRTKEIDAGGSGHYQDSTAGADSPPAKLSPGILDETFDDFKIRIRGDVENKRFRSLEDHEMWQKAALAKLNKFRRPPSHGQPERVDIYTGQIFAMEILIKNSKYKEDASDQPRLGGPDSHTSKPGSRHGTGHGSRPPGHNEVPEEDPSLRRLDQPSAANHQARER
jgi:hypothetical protein